MLAMENPFASDTDDVEMFTLQPFIDRETKFDPRRVMELVLKNLTQQVPCDAAYLAVRSGDIFRIEFTWNCTEELHREGVINSSG